MYGSPWHWAPDTERPFWPSGSQNAGPGLPRVHENAENQIQGRQALRPCCRLGRLPSARSCPGMEVQRAANGQLQHHLWVAWRPLRAGSTKTPAASKRRSPMRAASSRRCAVQGRTRAASATQSTGGLGCSGCSSSSPCRTGRATEELDATWTQHGASKGAVFAPGLGIDFAVLELGFTGFGLLGLTGFWESWP